MDLNLNGHTALVTGAASGIGRATAQLFAAEGSSLLLWDVSAEVEQVARNIASQYGVEVNWWIVDIVDLPALQQALAAHLSLHQPIKHVVHCAAIGSGKFGFPFTNIMAEDWRRTLEVNIMGMTNLALTLTPHLIEQAQGTFVFLASVAGQIGSQTDPPYSASKAANINFAQCMAKDLARHNIRVNTVCPGMVKTALNRSVWQAWYAGAAAGERRSYEEWAESKIRAVVPLGRWQNPEDVAAMIVFLSSDRAQQITGQTINVDGGFVMHW